MDNLISLVQSSIDKYEQAARIADTLIEEKLCACIHIVGPMTSIYRWDGRVVNDQEYLLSAKTARSKVSACKTRLMQLHTYDLPEIIVLHIDDASKDYARWVCNQ